MSAPLAIALGFELLALLLALGALGRFEVWLQLSDEDAP